MKLAYENSSSQPQGASYMPKNVIREEQGTRHGAGAPESGAFYQTRALANRSGQDQAMARFGVKRSSLTQPGTPPTNLNDVPPPRRPVDRIPEAGTGYATNGAQLGGAYAK